jgi:hypothetical protein
MSNQNIFNLLIRLIVETTIVTGHSSLSANPQDLKPIPKTQQLKLTSKNITKEDILAAQKSWAQRIVEIGQYHTNKQDHQARARKLINNLYAFKASPVLFKPTLSSKAPFRNNFKDALPYFIGGHLKEDHGFALKPCKKVKFTHQDTIINKNYAVAMGTYQFTD